MSLSRTLAVTAILALPVFTFADSPLDGWKPKHADKGKWAVGSATIDEKNPAKFVVKEQGSEIVNVQPASDLVSESKYGDVLIELEFMIPKGSNSGVYLMGEYEVQILDSFGKPDDKLGPGDMGGIYSTAAPKKNACKNPASGKNSSSSSRPRSSRGPRRWRTRSSSR